MNTFTRLGISLVILLPMSALAFGGVVTAVDQMIDLGYWIIILGALCGGISSTFIETEVDHKLKFMSFAKTFIGTVLGIVTCLSWMAHVPETTTMKLALPAFVLGCLGAPIVIFGLSWATDPNTIRKAGKALDNKLGL